MALGFISVDISEGRSFSNLIMKTPKFDNVLSLLNCKMVFQNLNYPLGIQ
ncbi:MAG: hypothetical protein ACJA1H_002144 [Glaciecola sp.]|jgi:hypothetical protein